MARALVKTIGAPPAPLTVFNQTYNLTSADAGRLFLAATFPGPVIFQLPQPSVVGAGFYFTVKDSQQNWSVIPVTFKRFSSEIFDGLGADYIANTDGAQLTVETDGSAWYIVSK